MFYIMNNSAWHAEIARHFLRYIPWLPHNIPTQIGNMFPILLRHPVALIGIRQFLYLFPREPAFQQLEFPPAFLSCLSSIRYAMLAFG